MEAYFAALSQDFERAAAACSTQERTFRIGNQPVQIACAGVTLQAALFRALAHLESPDLNTAAPALRVLAWDGAETGVAPTPSPLTADTAETHIRVRDPNGRFVGLFIPQTGTLSLLDRASRTAIYWTRSATELPTHLWGAPLLEIFRWWSQDWGGVLVHAACVGDETGAVLLAGKGGAGKSTTALLCLAAGMRYVSDDYCLVADVPVPAAYSLYGVGKLERSHLARFSWLARLGVDPNPDPFLKPVCFLHAEFPAQLARSLPLRAILLPQVTETRTTTTVTATSRAAALQALAPSTLFQLPDPGSLVLRRLAHLAQALPAFVVELGDLNTVARAIAALLRQLQ